MAHPLCQTWAKPRGAKEIRSGALADCLGPGKWRAGEGGKRPQHPGNRTGGPAPFCRGAEDGPAEKEGKVMPGAWSSVNKSLELPWPGSVYWKGTGCCLWASLCSSWDQVRSQVPHWSSDSVTSWAHTHTLKSSCTLQLPPAPPREPSPLRKLCPVVLGKLLSPQPGCRHVPRGLGLLTRELTLLPSTYLPKGLPRL